MSTSSLVLGIDVGCSTAAVAVFRQGAIDQVANEQGSRMTPSCIAFTEVETLIGEPARGQLARNAVNTIIDGPRLLGRMFDDEAFQTEMRAAGWRFRVSKGKDGAPQLDVTVKGEAKSFPAPRLLSLLLARLRADAEAATGEAVKEAVISFPAHFDELQRAALKEAAQIGGIRVKKMLNAPLCVALLYGQTVGNVPATPAPDDSVSSSVPVPSPEMAAPQQLLVVDVGGSEIVASVVERVLLGTGGAADDGARTASDEYSVRASIHERGCGGNEVDGRVRAHVLKEIRRRQRVDLSDNARAMARLLAACQVAKHSLTASAQATITVEADGADYFCNLSRAALEDLTSVTASQAAQLASRALAAAGLAASQVHALLLAGGGARMPRVQAALSALCPHAPVHFAGASEESVSRGAALSGALLRPLTLSDTHGERQGSLAMRSRLPYALAIATADGSSFRLAEANAAVPLTRTARFAAPGGGSSLLLSLLELLPPDEAAGTAGEAAAANHGGGAPTKTRTVATLALRELPSGLVALLLRLSIDKEKRLTLVCEGEAHSAPLTGKEDAEQERVVLGSVQL